MLRVFGDFESHYDKGYSLRLMSPVEYILDKRWETLACAVAIDHENPFLLPQNEVAEFLRSLKQPYCFISHNALFDSCVLAFRYRIHPTMMLCTLSMARALLYYKVGRLSLKALLKYLNFNPKSDFINNMVGVHWSDLVNDPGKMMQFTGYAINDVEGCRDLFFAMREDFPVSEALLLDRTIKMATQPILKLNFEGLVGHLTAVVDNKNDLLARVTADKSALMSNPKMADELRKLGIEPPTKISPTTGRTTFAFARTDHKFMELLEHDDPYVQALVAARLGIKTTMEETRTKRLLDIGMLTNGVLPVPLKYAGAHTFRLSGDWQLNLQNLGSRKQKAIRTAILAPDGYTIVAVDAAQIEARIVAWLAGQEDLLKMFAAGEDTYKAFAGEIFFHDHVGQVTKPERFVGKTCILGLGFGMSAEKLFWSITTLAREQGIPITITKDDCQTWVRAYRRKFSRVPVIWNQLGRLIHLMSCGEADGWQIGPCVVEGTTIMLPSGLRLHYENLRRENGEYVYSYGPFTKRLYGGKLLENIVQALDWCHVSTAGLRTEFRAREAGVADPRMLLNVHDENVYCVKSEQAHLLAELALEEMVRNAEWSAGLPLAAEVKLGANYGELVEWKP